MNLKSHIHESEIQTGSDDFFLGHGTKASAKEILAPSEDTIRNTIVPALIRALQTETNNDIVTGAMLALAKIGDERGEGGESDFEKLFLPFLKDGNQEIAETAAMALGILGNPASIQTLEHLLNDDAQGRELVGSEAGVNYRTRAFAAFGLGQVGHYCGDVTLQEEVVRILWETCESPKGRTRDVKVAAIISMGLVPLEVQTDPSPDSEYEGAPRHRQEQIDYLLNFFLDDSNRDRHYLVRAHAPRAITKLMKGLDDSKVKDRVTIALAPYVSKRGHIGERELRQSAVLAYGSLGDLDQDESDRTIRLHLIDSMGNADAQVKNFSLIALGQVGGRLGKPDEQHKGLKQVRRELQQHLAKGKTQMRPWAGLAMGIMERELASTDVGQSSDMLSALRSSLSQSKTKDEVGAYAIALGLAGDLDSQDIMMEKLDTMADDEVRGHLAIGLGLMNAGEAQESIKKLVKDSKYRGELLKQAAISLGLLGDKKVVNQLVGMLKDANTLTTRAALASALGFIGDASSVAPLVEMLENESYTDAARGFAAVALGVVADRESLPFNAKFAEDINYRANTHTLTGGGGTGLLDIL